MAGSLATYGISYGIYMVRVPMGLRVKQTSLRLEASDSSVEKVNDPCFEIRVAFGLP